MSHSGFISQNNNPTCHSGFISQNNNHATKITLNSEYLPRNLKHHVYKTSYNIMDKKHENLIFMKI